jgi:hypothetical protein
MFGPDAFDPERACELGRAISELIELTTDDFKAYLTTLDLENAVAVLVRDPLLVERLAHNVLPFRLAERQIGIIECRDFSDLKVLDEKTMNDAGWYRRDR